MADPALDPLPPLRSGGLLPAICADRGWELNGDSFHPAPRELYRSSVLILAAMRALWWRGKDAGQQVMGDILADLDDLLNRASDILPALERAGFPPAGSEEQRYAYEVAAASATHLALRLGQQVRHWFRGEGGQLRPDPYGTAMLRSRYNVTIKPDGAPDPDSRLCALMWSELRRAPNVTSARLGPNLAPAVADAPLTDAERNILQALAESGGPLSSTRLARRAGYKSASHLRENVLPGLRDRGLVDLVSRQKGWVITDRGRASLMT